MSSSRSSSRSRRHRTKRATSATSDVAKQVSDEIVRPASSMELSYPKKPILATLGYEGARHVISDYLPSSRFDNVVGMRLPDLSQQTANLVRDLRDTLRRIDLSGFQLVTPPDDLLSALDSLVQLDLSNNCLTDLSALATTSTCLSRLVELVVYNNSLCRPLSSDLAAQLAPSLRRLNVAHNKLTSFEDIDRLTNLEAASFLTLCSTLSIFDIEIDKDHPTLFDKYIEIDRLIGVLIVDDNMISSINPSMFNALSRLQVFHCARNAIPELPPTVKYLRYLRDMNLSENKLTVVPAELIALPRIEVINLSGNAIARIPTVRLPSRRYSRTGGGNSGSKQQPQQQQHRCLSVVDLSDNALVKFPQQLLTLVRDRLDLSRNQIAMVPLSLERKLSSRDSSNDKNSGRERRGATAELVMNDNPVVCPPEDVCRCGMRAILNYLREAKAHLPTYQGLKVLVIGSSGQGKTSLIQTLIDDQPTLTGEDRTAFFDIFEHAIDSDQIIAEDDLAKIQNSIVDPSVFAACRKELTLTIWDMSGNERYSTPQWHFVESQALVMIVFNLAEYEDQRFGTLIGSWIDMVIGKCSRLVCVIVGTHADYMGKDAERTKMNVMNRVNSYLAERSNFLDGVVRSIETLPHIDAVQSEHLKHAVSLKKIDVRVHPEVICVSSRLNTGFDELVSVIRRLGQDHSVFPQSLRRIPSLWDDVEQYVEGRGEQLMPPVLPWSQYEKMVVDRFGLKRAVPGITQYLHDSAKVLWFSKHETLSKYVILRPTWLIDALRYMLRHDLLEVQYQPTIDDASTVINGRQSTAQQVRMEKMKSELFKQGLVEIECLRAIWSHLMSSPSDSDTTPSATLNDLIAVAIDNLQLGYSLSWSFVRDGVTSRPPLRVLRAPPPDNSAETGTTPGPGLPFNGGNSVNVGGDAAPFPGDQQVSRSRFLITCLRRVGRPRTFQAEYDRLANLPSLAAVYQFPLYAPTAMLFDRITVRLAARSVATITAGQQAAVNGGPLSPRRPGGGRAKDATSRDKPAPKHRLVVVYHWQFGFYAYDYQLPVRIYVQRGKRKDGGVSFIRIEARLDTGTPAGETESQTADVIEDLWSVLLPVLEDVDSLLATCAGVFVERWMECPRCHSTSFHGAWRTPKQLQNVNTAKCQSCDQSVETMFLVQPKEKRMIDQFLQLLAAQTEQQQQGENNTQQEQEIATESSAS